MAIKIAPSILSADFARLGEDGHFVPNLTIGPVVVKSIRPYTNKIFDVHLMIEPVDPFIESYVKAGADIITVHAEATKHLDRTLAHITSLGVKAGVSLVPSSPANLLDYVMEKLDLILVMSVNPGFGGQTFLPSQLKKITQIRAMITATGKPIDLQVDGGINPETARQVIAAGADVLVAGSAVFGGDNKEYATRIRELRG